MTHRSKKTPLSRQCQVGDIVYQHYGEGWGEVMFFKVIGVVGTIMATIVEIDQRKEYVDAVQGYAYPLCNNIIGQPACVRIEAQDDFYFLDDGFLHAYPCKEPKRASFCEV